jgi:hypothetical protein
MRAAIAGIAAVLAFAFAMTGVAVPATYDAVGPFAFSEGCDLEEAVSGRMKRGGGDVPRLCR